jgi:transcriptional regulator with XRE-family HTH domain
MLAPREAIPEMGTVSRETPRYLAQNLLKIRKTIDGGLSQEEMVKRLGLPWKKNFNRTYISKYEQGVLEPPLSVLLAYARLISITGRGEFLEALIDDGLEIPDDLPAAPAYGELKDLSKGKVVRRSKKG